MVDYHLYVEQIWRLPSIQGVRKREDGCKEEDLVKIVVARLFEGRKWCLGQ